MRAGVSLQRTGNSRFRRNRWRVVQLAALSAMGVVVARAPGDTYTWTGAANSNWEDAGNWSSVSGAGTFPHLIDDVVKFDDALTSRFGILLSSHVTIGNLAINNTNGPVFSFNSGTSAGSITFQKTTGSAQASANIGSALVRVSLDIDLASDLAISQTGVPRFFLGAATNSLNLAGHTLSSSGISGVGALIQNTNGAVSLNAGGLKVLDTTFQLANGGNTFSGVTTLAGGTLQLNATPAMANVGLPSNSGIGLVGASGTTAAAIALNQQSLIVDIGTLQFNDGAGATTNRLFTLGKQAFIGNNSGGSTSSVVFNNTNAIAFTGTANHSLTLQGSAGTNVFSPQLTDDAAGGLPTELNKANLSVWIVNNPNNSYTGGTSVAEGILRIGVDNGVSPNSVLQIGRGHPTSATFDLFGHNQTVAGLQSSVQGVPKILTNTGTAASTLSINLPSGTQVYDGVIGGTSNNAITVVKSGGGTQVLSGDSTFIGPMTVYNGVLIVDGAVKLRGNVSASSSVGRTAILGGNGSVSLGLGQVVAVVGVASNNGVIAPGDAASRGTLTVNGGNGVIFDDLSRLQADTGVTPTDTDLLKITGTSGNLDLSSPFDTLDLNALVPGTFTIVSFTGTRSGTFDTVLLNGVTENGTLIGNVFTAPDVVVTYNDTLGARSVQVQVLNIPEPTSVAGLAIPGLLLLAKRRRAAETLRRS